MDSNQQTMAPVLMAQTQGASEDTRTIVTVLLLIFAYPIGAILAIFWTRWPKWVKILVTLPITLLVVIGFFAILFAIIITALNPSAQIKKADKVAFMNECAKTYTEKECTQKYIEEQLQKSNIKISVSPIE